MADEKSKLEFRDLNEEEGEVYLTKPTSQLDLERRLDDGHVPDSDVSERTFVNPNPFGEEDYAGTDPIYQNYAEDTHQPLRADEGAEKDAEDAVRELYETDNPKIADPGLGGESTRADTSVLDQGRYLVPGQEGYPENPEKYVGPAVPAAAVEADQGGDDSDEEESEEAKQPGPTVQPPASPASTTVSHGSNQPSTGNQ